MEKKDKKFQFNDLYSFDTLGQESIDKMSTLNAMVYGSPYGFTSEGTEELLTSILTDLAASVTEIENIIAANYYEVDYYRKQADVLNLPALKQQYMLSSFKMSLLQSRLAYLRQLESSVKTLLNKKNEIKLKK